ncbi:MAG: TspO/MBR family protein [Candidatus Paceibacterota bacterium]
MIQRILKILSIALVVGAVAYLGSSFTSAGFTPDSQTGISWYESLTLPEWTPDGSVIGIAWGIIYLLTGISAIIFYSRGVIGRRNYIVTGLFLINAVTNVLWSYFFFTEHAIGYAIFDMLLLLLSIYLLIHFIRKISIISAMLLYPYFLWVAFATILTVRIYMLNVV